MMFALEKAKRERLEATMHHFEQHMHQRELTLAEKVCFPLCRFLSRVVDFGPVRSVPTSATAPELHFLALLNFAWGLYSVPLINSARTGVKDQVQILYTNVVIS